MKEGVLERKNRSEEIQDIIDRMPTIWTRYVTGIVVFFISVLIFLGFLIKYPDTVIGEVTITSSQAPVRLQALGTGRLHLLLRNRDSVDKGDIIAYIDDGAVLKDILSLDSLLNGVRCTGSKYPPSLMLGSLSTAYDTWVAAWHETNQLRTTKIYSNMRKGLDEQLHLNHSLAESQQRQLLLSTEQYRIYHIRQEKDSVLHLKGVISDEEMERKQNTFVLRKLQLMEQESSLLSTKSAISQNRIERARIDISEMDEVRRSQDKLSIRELELRSAIRQWKEKYLLIAPANGQIEYMGFWREHDYVQAGQVIFSILPPQGSVFGEAYITAAGFGKVEVGQLANVKLTNYPYAEFGHIVGRVESISRLAHTIQTPKGVAETYLVVIIFPNGMMTNFGQLLNVGYEAQGHVEIITKPKRIIQRLFDNLRSKKEK